MNTEAYREYEKWIKKAKAAGDEELLRSLTSMDEKETEDAFYKNLQFGTGGLRGVLGAGTNRMNIFTVAKASQGLADYVNSLGGESIAISYDSRKFSRTFAQTAASVFAANGLKVYLWPELMPTPVLSFTTRYFGCRAGVMITASHNPSEYNGYKVYNDEGCQITTEAARIITAEIEKLDIFGDVKKPSFEDMLSTGRIETVGNDVYDAYINEVRRQSDRTESDGNLPKLKIIYTPLNGTGLRPVTRILADAGFDDVTVVKEQQNPDGNFPTCPYPNPEEKKALSLGLEYMKREGADLLLATDPDCDRVGIAVRDGGECRLMTGNQVGALLIDYLCRSRQIRRGDTVIKTIVTSELGAKIAESHGIEIFSVLTGFKYIGERIGQFEKKKDRSFFFGYEESYGYLAGTHARDKDAVVASMLICETADYWKQKGKTLADRLGEIYEEFGFYKDALDSFTLEGKTGQERIGEMMAKLRRKDMPSPFPGAAMTDYSVPVPAEPGYGYLPEADVIKYSFGDGSWIAVRPSGTEPKIKIYYSIRACDEKHAERLLENYRRTLGTILGIEKS